MTFARLFQGATGAVHADAYNTAWVALVPHINHSQKPQWPETIQLLHNMQLPDGGWGAPIIYHAHERTLCTLAALVALLTWQEKDEHRASINRGVAALHRYAQELAGDPHELVGYELLLPRLLQLLRPFSLDLPYQAWEKIVKMGEHKRGLIGQLQIERTQPRAWWFSAEMLTEAQLAQFDDSFLNHHGAIATATAPTAAYLRACRLRGQDSPRAAAFLARVLALGNGGAALAWPIEHFEQLWMLDQFRRVQFPATHPTVGKLMGNLMRSWMLPPLGFSSSIAFAVADGDDTSVGYDLLRWAGFKPSPAPLLAFWSRNHFRTYLDERTTSMTVNLHALSALKHDLADIPEFARYAELVVEWLRPQFKTNSKFNDKWHYSPIYVAARAVDTIGFWDKGLGESCLDFLLAEQQADGGWGCCRVATVEETGYALIGLMAAYRVGLLQDKRPLRQAAQFLYKHRHAPAQEHLWLGKALFHSPKIVGAIRLATAYGLEQMGLAIEPYQSSYF